MSLKLVPAVLLLFVAVAAGLGQAFRDADASVTGPLVPSATTMMSGATPITITIPVGAPNPDEDIVISTTGLDLEQVSGTLLVVGCTPGCLDDLGKSTNTDVTSVTVVTDSLTQVVVALGLTCTENSSVTVTADTSSDPSQSTIIGCIAPINGDGGGGAANGGQVVATATPNMLPCEGGTSIINAEVVDDIGNTLEDATFRFETTAGAIEQIDADSARLTLGPNQISATVTAKIFDPDDPSTEVLDPRVLTATVEVFLACNGGATLVVTASPNVIDCTGTTTITASVRDANGHVVPGRGFHFVTTAGLLKVDPNNASTEEGRATLRLEPGDGDAQVTVSSGLLHGTYEDQSSVDGNYVDDTPDFATDEVGFVTVQQDCLSTTTGQIQVNASAKTLTCGETVFIGLSVIDEDIQTVMDGTPMTLIATAGGFYGGEGVLLTAAQVPTTHGEANTIYTAPANFNGEVKITAASGDAYGYQKLFVTCVTAPNTGTGAVGNAGPTCTPIGDGVCIPNQITPPNTGSAGMK